MLLLLLLMMMMISMTIIGILNVIVGPGNAAPGDCFVNYSCRQGCTHLSHPHIHTHLAQQYVGTQCAAVTLQLSAAAQHLHQPCVHRCCCLHHCCLQLRELREVEAIWGGGKQTVLHF
jgi:hypothetical protein